MKYVAIFMLLVVAQPSTADGLLPAPVRAAIEQHGLSTDSISIHVTDPARGVTLLSYHADTPRNPASAMKLVTTYAALDLLGPGYTWRTEYLVDGPIRDGVLHGNLHIRGGGDPMILVEDFLRTLFLLRQRGLRDIRGDLVVDTAYFDEASIDTDPIDGQVDRAYNAWPGSMVINFRATRFIVTPTDDAIEVIADPPARTLRIDNRLSLVDGPCRGRHGRISLDVVERGLPTVVRLQGDFPGSCGEQQYTRSVLDPDAYLYGVFESMWTSLGGSIDGRLVYGTAPGDATRLIEYESRPLTEVLRGVNKFSNNLMARALLLTLGAEILGAPGTVEGGRVVVANWLQQHALSLPNLMLDNGAGLSRNARITARGLSAVLEHALAHPFREEYLASLSLVGIDGSTRTRLRDGDQTGRYRLKTGLLRGVRAAAGYGLTARGTQLVIVIVQNSDRLDFNSGNAIQDAVLTYLHKSF